MDFSGALMRSQRECAKRAEDGQSRPPGKAERDTCRGQPGDTRHVVLGDSATKRRQGLFRMSTGFCNKEVLGEPG